MTKPACAIPDERQCMKTYAIGDIHGCLLSLKKLIQKIEKQTPDARYLFTGDLINRGVASLETLRFVRDLGKRAITVLGNHDLHFLAIAASDEKKQLPGPLDAILKAPDKEELITWLRFCPMAYYENGYLLVHAGVLPQWSALKTIALAREVESILQDSDWRIFMGEMYGDSPAKWDDGLSGQDRMRCIINGLTRLRFCNEAGEMEFETKEGLSAAPSGFIPWFDVSSRQTQNETVIFGHWSTLGLLLRQNLIALDTGCVWGRKLTAVCLENREILQVDCQGECTPGAL